MYTKKLLVLGKRIHLMAPLFSSAVGLAGLEITYFGVRLILQS